MSEAVLVREQRGGVLILRLNRPEARNALTPELITAVGTGIEGAVDDESVRCIVLTGTGDRAFCSGMDLAGFAAGGTMSDEDRRGMEAFLRFTRGELAIPVVGAANATAVAGGFELLMGCDLVVASNAARFGIPEVKRGLFAAGGGVYVSTRIPLALALELTLIGDLIDADRALSLGLINQVVSPDDVVDAAVELAQRIARNGPLAVAATRELVRTAAIDVARARELERGWQARVFSSDDAKEGAMAFVEKRDPVWTGH
jgi:enoyl-CoA hydratase/carnithine racemase